MQLKAKEITHRTLTFCGKTLEYFMLLFSLNMTCLNGSKFNVIDTTATT